MRKLLLMCAAAAAFSLAAAAAKADAVVYNGGAPNLASADTADSADFIAVYVSFVLPAGVSSITDAEWWGGCYPATTCGAESSFSVSVLSNTGSGPGTVIATDDVGARIRQLREGASPGSSRNTSITHPFPRFR